MTREKAEQIFGTWIDVVAPFVTSEAFDNILAELGKQKREGKIILPEQKDIFRCFKETKLEDLRFVIIGQDPYPKQGVANGLAFSTSTNVETPKSLQLIYDAIDRDCGKSDQPRNNDLSYLCNQGGLLFNSSLTVVADTPNSHKDIWAPFSEFFISRLQSVTRGIIWFTWGKEAQMLAKNIDIFAGGHYIVAEEHPVAALYRCAKEQKDPIWKATCFSKANAIIRANRMGELIKW